MKRVLSCILIVSLLLSISSIGAFADWSGTDPQPEAKLSVAGVNGSNPEALIAGQKVEVTLTISGLNKYWSSYQSQLSFDSEAFELDISDSYGVKYFDTTENCADLTALFGDVVANIDIPGQLIITCASGGLAPQKYGPMLAGDDTHLRDIVAFTATFTAKETISAGEYVFSVPKMAEATLLGTDDTPYQLSFTVASGYSKVTTSTDDLRETVNVVESNSVVITGADAIAAPIAGDDEYGWPKDNTIEAQYGVTVFGSNGVIENPTVTWDISGNGDKVTIDNSGKVTIKSGAAAGDYTITATASIADNTGLDKDAAGTKTIRVTKEDSVPSRIKGREPAAPAGPYVIPDDGANAVSEQFSIYVWDQYGVEMADPDVKWKLSPSDVPGVSLSNNGLLTITNDAKNSSIDTTGAQFTINAYCGELGPVATDVTVKRADSVATSVAIYKGEEVVTSDSITVPTGDISNTVTYTAKVFDQYGTEITNASVTWNTEGSVPSGVTVANDTVTVQKGATTGSFTLKAASGNIKTPLTVNVVTIAFTGQDTAVSAVDSPIYGMTWGEIIKVNDSAISAKVGETQVEGTYSVENADTIPDAGNSVEYRVIFTSNDGNYVGVEVARGTVEIAQKPVTVSGITANDKVYDGTTVAELNTYSASIGGKVGNDDVTIDVANATGTFDTKNVGTGKTVTITDITLGGNDAGNYTLSSDSATTTADITAKELTANVSSVSVTKEYDGTTAAGTVNGTASVTGTVGGETVTVNVSAGEYADKNVGTDKTVTLTLSLSGDNASNYTLSNTTVEIYNAEISAKDVTKSEDFAQNVVVGVGTFTEPKFTGIGGEEVTGTVTYSYDGKTSYDEIVNALKSLSEGQTATIGYSFTPTDSNYTGTITGTITVTMVDIVFTVDGEPATADNAVTIKDNPTYGDTWSEIVTIKEDDIVATLSGETLYGGTYSLNVSDMPDAGGQDYTVRYTYEGKTYDVCSGTVTVARRALTITGIGAEDKEYNGTTAATVTGTATLKGLVGTDTFTVSNGTAAFASKDAGTQTVTFTGFSITGEGADNYTLTQPDSVTATISPKSVTIENVAVSDKTYDGNRDATIANSGTISGIISSDNVTIQSGTGTFASADVGTGITVTFSSFSLSGDDAGNYTLSAQPASTTADITKANYTGTPNTVNVNVLINQSAAQTGSVSIDQFFQTIPAGAVITSVAPASGSVMDSVAVEDGVIKYSSKANLETENVTDTYTVTIATQNYNNITATLTFTTVAKTPVNISGVSVTGAGKTYDGKAVSYTGTPAAKTNDGKTVAVTGTYSYVWQKADGTVLASAPKDAGIYKLVITLDDPAYIGSAEVSFTIAKAKITITAEDAEAYTGSDMPKLSYTVTGLATGEKLAKEPSVSCAADMKKAGSYVIAVSGAEVPNTNNYEETITYVSGTLEVKNRPVNIGPTYDIKVLDSAHGTVRASLGNASEGSTIRLTVTPDEGYSLANLIVRDERGRRIDVAKSGGVYRFVMPAGDVTIEAVFAQGTTVLPFTDVSTYDWFYEYVKYVYDNGIMDGIDVGVFGPGITTTRAMLVTMLYRVAGEPYVSGTNDFADVAANTWYTDAVTWASKNGIVTGVDVGVFNPNGAITREQLATILYRYAEYVGEDVSARASLSRFTDTGSISAYARDAMSWAVAEGILDGRTATELAPTGECTRAEVATMIARAFG